MVAFFLRFFIPVPPFIREGQRWHILYFKELYRRGQAIH
ncbi:hypothetical protein B4081_4580 [Bacillus cereus]|nr:hypothetical protein B4081_4580 [Bacillus cereus]